MPGGAGPPLSARNPRLVHLRELAHSRRARRRERRYVVEGPRLLAEALDAAAPIEEAFAGPGAPESLLDRLAAAGVPVHPVAAGGLDRAGEVRTSQGVAAVVAAPALEPPAAVARGALVLALCGVADPGNVGTLLRTADATGAAAVLLSGPCADPLSPKVVRAAAGALFRLAVAEVDDPLAVLDGWGLTPLGAVRDGGRPLDEVDLTGGVGLLLGSEAHGLPPTVADPLAGSQGLVSIPMPGRAESLNVAMAGTILAFEAVRQRRARTMPAPRGERLSRAPAGQEREAATDPSASREPIGLASRPRAGLSTVEELLERVSGAGRAALERLAGAADLDQLRAVEVDALGRRSPLVELRKALGGLDADGRRTVGQALNATIAEVEAAAADRRTALREDDRRQRLQAERLDLTEVTAGSALGHAHLVAQAWERLEDVFVGMGFTVSEGPEVETEWYNFAALNFPDGHPARESFDSLWVDWGEPGSTLLRTHTSPVQVRAMLATEPPIYTICPGRVFRQDTPDATHMPVFHQLEGLVVDRGITMGDLSGTLDSFTKAYFGADFSARLRPSYFPFTEPSAEFDILRPDGSWLELGGCGMVHPNVLRSGGVDPEEWSGFAFGFGIDRMALMRHGVDDLREFFAGDLRFLTQF